MAFNGGGAGRLVVDGVRYGRAQGSERFPGQACNEETARTLNETRADRGDLLRRLAVAEDDFGQGVAQAAVVVDLGEAQVLVGQVAQRLDRGVDAETAGGDALEERSQLCVLYLSDLRT